MKKFITYLIIGLTVLVNLTSCKDDPVYDEDQITKQTMLVLFYMPWTGTATQKDALHEALEANLDSIKQGIIDNGLANKRVMVYFNTTATQAKLYELKVNNNQVTENLIRDYNGTSYTTADGIADIIYTAFSTAPALNYSLVIGCHGMGWTYKEDWTNYPFYAKTNRLNANASEESSTDSLAVEEDTRFFGSVASAPQFGVDLSTLKEALEIVEGKITYPETASHKLQYILFDDCYMANVETAYELKDVTNYLVASTSEIMGEGLPYRKVFNYLSSATPSYSSIVSTFYNYYKTRAQNPYGELSAINCNKMDDLADFMNRMNAKYTLADSLRDSVQVLDGFGYIGSYPIFYDMTDYVSRLGLKTSELENYNDLMEEVVVAHQNTTHLYTYLVKSYGWYTIPVKTCCGLTISDLSKNSVALKGKEKTAWWKATHTTSSK